MGVIERPSHNGSNLYRPVLIGKPIKSPEKSRLLWLMASLQVPGRWDTGNQQSPQPQFSRLYNPTATVKSLQSCPTLCDPIDGSPPGSPIPGILQAKALEWVAISSSNA